MKATLPLLLLLLALPVRAEELQPSFVVMNATHWDAWRIARQALKRGGVTATAREAPAERALALRQMGLDGTLQRMPNN
jgi:polar amino acid transport system substrate-binding protein